MGQGEVVAYLWKCDEPKTCKEINKALKGNNGQSLRRLRNHGELNFKIIKIKGVNTFLYWSKNGKK